MAKDAIVFACANPVPEIWPWEAKQAGARIVASGRSDFSNQVNNSLGFPAIFRGVIDVAASTITDEMCIADAEELARCAEIKGLSEEHILPTMTTGAGRQLAAQHSHSLEGWYAHIPGIKILTPATLEDARGMRPLSIVRSRLKPTHIT